ncbi:MAG: EF-P beta-lysylation protein EpmB [Pirellulales bacterium]|nr:EF-P beta-lysylation protein EpmB [Pirellulales bacterium]
MEILATVDDLVPGSSPQPILVEPVDWQTAMKRAIRCVDQLRSRLGLPSAWGGSAGPNRDAVVSFPTFVPLEFLKRIRPGDERDPLLLQVLPSEQEQLQADGFHRDPVGDLQAVAAEGLLHKYSSRVLVISTGACGVHCRYCFRREFPYQEAAPRSEKWRPALAYVKKNRQIDEVILSGGDPLTLVDGQLFELIEQIEAVDHVQRLRIHTRMPIVIPQRVTETLAGRLAQSRLTCWLVIHANHPRELDADVLDRLSLLSGVGIPLLNQSVLLRGVNDDAQTLIRLCQVLVNHRVQPYYLHQLDRVAGAAHFEVPIDEGQRLMQQLVASLPGYAVPKYVTEQPGQPAKTAV